MKKLLGVMLTGAILMLLAVPAWAHEAGGIARPRTVFGTIGSLSENGLTLESRQDGALVVNISQQTTIVDYRGRAITAASLSVGHRVRVKGIFDFSSGSFTEVYEIKDYSVRPRTVFGIITSITGDVLTVVLARGGETKVEITGQTRLIDRREGPISILDLAVGHRVRLKGSFDFANCVFVNISELKDYNLPVFGQRQLQERHLERIRHRHKE